MRTMKRTRRHIAGTLCAVSLAGILCPSLSCCTTDAYDKGDGTYSLMEAEMANVHVDGNLRADYMVTDDGERLAVANPFSAAWMSTPDSTYRAVAYFVRDDGGSEVKGLNRVGVATPKKIEGMKSDPVRFESVWMGRTGEYLNICIYVLTGTADDEGAVQTLGCNDDTLTANADGSHTQRLTLYHDQGGVPEYYSQRTYVSIPLAGIHADSVSIAVNTYAGRVEKTLPTARE